MKISVSLPEEDVEFLDNYENKITGRQRLFPCETVLANTGKNAIDVAFAVRE